MASGTGKKDFYDRIIGTQTVDGDYISTLAPKAVDNELMEKRDRSTNRERSVTSHANPPNPSIVRSYSLVGGAVTAGSRETGVDIPSAGSDTSGEEPGFEGSPRTIVDEMGNSISIESDGSLVLQHSKGSKLSLRPDGALFIEAMGEKGININSGKGGINFHSQGKVVFESQDGIVMDAKGGGISMHTAGAFPLTMDVGGNMSMKVGQSFNKHVSATDYSFVGGSQSTMVFGNGDYQVQGDFKVGSATKLNMDSPTTHIGARETLTLNSEGTGVFATKGNLTALSQAKLTVGAVGTVGVASSGGRVYVLGNKAVNMESKGPTTVRGDIINVEAVSGMTLDSKEYLFTRAKTLAASAQETLTIKSGAAFKISSMTTLDLDAGGAINLAGATIDLNSRAKDPTEPDDPMVTTPRVMQTTKKIEDLYPEEQLEADNFVSKEAFQAMNRDFKPKQEGFPVSDSTMSEDEYNAYKNGGGQLPSGAEENSNSKPTGGSTVSDGETYGDRGSAAEYNESVAREPDIPPPTSSNPADPIGLNALRGIPGAEAIPGDGQADTDRDTIYANLLHLQENIRLPLIAEHPDVRTARGFILKYDNNDDNPHYKGLALDFIVANKRDLPRLVEVAYWASGNLPCKLVRIEKTKTYSYLHIEAAEVGQSGKDCKTETCSDIEGKNCQSGLPVKTYVYKDAEVSGRAKKGFYKGFEK